MVKNKKEDTGELVVSIEQFTRTRDSVIVSLSNVQKGLASVQNHLQELMHAYIKHTASVVAGEDGFLESLQLSSDVTETANAASASIAFTNNAVQAIAQPAAAAANAKEETGKNKKRKRDKKEKDPHAPKRPLTAAFLHAKMARDIVKADLEASLQPGEKLAPNAVNYEVNKRWNDMPEDEKETWRQAYRENREKYKKELIAYAASKGEGASVDGLAHLDEETQDEAEVEAGALDSDASDDSDDDAAEPSPVAKAPTPPVTTNGKTPRAAKRQKTAATPAATPAVNGASAAPVAIAPGPRVTPVPLPNATSAVQKTHVSAPGVEAASSAAPPVTPAPKSSKDKKKKEKPIAPAPTPAPAKEPSPEEGSKTSKKTKSGRATRNAEVEKESQSQSQEGEKEVKTAKKRDRSKRKSEAGAA